MQTQFKNIMVPIDMSENSKNTLKYALNMANDYKAKIYVIHIIEMTYAMSLEAAETFSTLSSMAEIEESVIKNGEAELKKFIEENAGDLPNYLLIQNIIKTGNPPDEIIKTALEKDIDIIIMGTHGRTGLSSILLGSVAEKVVKKAHCPVLTMKSEEAMMKQYSGREKILHY